ncbi:MAG: long-chain fatty acid--CoA ligase [Proteobacteria bacterium]|nr:long-chain fatty acid--CoA ligase [Desulfobacula sp.]MBU3953224.1 long-chain fatty acid--CoA ligase [Pseudomonadota bacterium]MBU4133432.1 long-chain fatty acid--CoA ligase [Pseudomonadota bacterium]
MEKTINEVFKNRAEKYKDRIAVEKKHNGVWESASWRQYYASASAIGLALHSMGVKRGDRVAILSENRLEWLYADMGTMGLGAVVVPIYTTLTPEEVGYVLENSEAKIIFVENTAQLDKVTAWQKNLPYLEQIIVMDHPDAAGGKDFFTGFKDFYALGRQKQKESPELFEQLSKAVDPTSIATIVYTSGTTGVPKGAMISHKNIMAVLHSLASVRPQYCFDTDQVVPFLPLSHVYGRLTDHFFGLYIGVTASYVESIETFARDIKEKRPHVIQAVPRVCEKVYQKILEQVDAQPGWKQRIFKWGHRIGIEISGLRERHAPISFYLKLRYKLAYFLVFKNLAQALGGRVRWMTASGAPTSRDIILFFNAAGITVVEGYGMTECCAPATMSHLDDYRIGTVGNPIPCVEIKIADDGEILIKGESVFAGYWKMEEETEKAFTPDGYLMSGDIGEMEEGFLKITDRKKDLIITSGGKNIAPQKIEGLFKFDPLFEHVIVIGERRKFLTALLSINLMQASLLSRKEKLAFDRPEALLDNPLFLKIVDDHVAERNTQLARYETIKRYRILKTPFSSQGGELTASLKLKRNVILKRYQELIEEMYADCTKPIEKNRPYQ